MGTVYLGVRVDAGLLERVDRVAAALTAKVPGMKEVRVRSYGARAALLRGLESLERELGVPPEPPTKPEPPAPGKAQKASAPTKRKAPKVRRGKR